MVTIQGIPLATLPRVHWKQPTGSRSKVSFCHIHDENWFFCLTLIDSRPMSSRLTASLITMCVSTNSQGYFLTGHADLTTDLVSKRILESISPMNASKWIWIVSSLIRTEHKQMGWADRVQGNKQLREIRLVTTWRLHTVAKASVFEGLSNKI